MLSKKYEGLEAGNQGNSSCPTVLPTSYEYLRNLPLAYLIIFGICGALTITTFVMYIETVVFFFRNLYNWKPKDKAKWVLAVYPIFSVTCFVSLIVPRSANVNQLVATCYLSVCIYQFVVMLIGHYGGAKLMANKLSGSSFELSTSPCCCCCKCLPSPKVTRENIHAVQSLVIQYAVLGPILSYCMAVIWANDEIYSNPFTHPSTYMNFLNTLASLVALWGMSVTFHFSAPLLQHAHVKPKFICMQLINVFQNMQGFIIDVLIISGVFPCEHLLDSVAVGLRYHNIALIVEVFILWWFARHHYRAIGDIPIEEQVYVQTCSIATNVTGTLLRDQDVSSNTTSSSYGPTCAKDLIKEEAVSRALTMMEKRMSPISFILDGASQNAHRRLPGNVYQLHNPLRVSDIGISTDPEPYPEYDSGPTTGVKLRKDGSRQPQAQSTSGSTSVRGDSTIAGQPEGVKIVDAGTNPAEGLATKNVQFRIKENPLERLQGRLPPLNSSLTENANEQ